MHSVIVKIKCESFQKILKCDKIETHKSTTQGEISPCVVLDEDF